MTSNITTQAAPASPGPVSDDRVAWYRRMLEIRAFEEKVQELFMDGLVEGTTHLCQGQEAVSVGAVSALQADDYLTITYRGHGHALARGMSMEAAFAELMGRTGGCCNGRRRLDAPHRLLARPDRLLRDHRRRACRWPSAPRCPPSCAARPQVAHRASAATARPTSAPSTRR